jgi:hypothetical protein
MQSVKGRNLRDGERLEEELREIWRLHREEVIPDDVRELVLEEFGRFVAGARQAIPRKTRKQHEQEMGQVIVQAQLPLQHEIRFRLQLLQSYDYHAMSTFRKNIQADTACGSGWWSVACCR